MTYSSLIILRATKQAEDDLEKLTSNKSNFLGDVAFFKKFYLQLILGSKPFYYVQAYFWVLFDGQILYLPLYFFFTVLGISLLEVFYAFTLLDIIARNESLQNVVRAVTLNAKALTLTGLLGFLFIYFFAIWATLWLQTDFTYNSYALCGTIFSCWQAMFEYGLLTGGSTNNGVLGPPPPTESNYPDRFMFDLVFFIIIILIFLNVFFGIIIDTFGDLRGQRETKSVDIKNVCFICSIDRATFDRNGTAFEIHTTLEHNVWNYLYYIVYIKTKEESEYTGIEKYVFNKIQEDDIGWFPMSKAMSLDTSSAANDDDDIPAQTKLINKKLDDLFRTAKDIIKKQQQTLDTNRTDATGRRPTLLQDGE